LCYFITMDKKTLRIAQAAGFLCLLAAMLMIFLSFTLFDFLPPASRKVTLAVYILNLMGSALGAVLCPLFLPLPGAKPKPLWRSALFLALLLLPNMVIRTIGLDFWLHSLPARIIQALNSGMFYPLGYGIFFLSWRYTEIPGVARYPIYPPPPPTGMAAALMAAVAARIYSIPLMELAGLTAGHVFPVRAGQMDYSWPCGMRLYLHRAH
jgi:hypothetical protein